MIQSSMGLMGGMPGSPWANNTFARGAMPMPQGIPQLMPMGAPAITQPPMNGTPPAAPMPMADGSVPQPLMSGAATPTPSAAPAPVAPPFPTPSQGGMPSWPQPMQRAFNTPLPGGQTVGGMVGNVFQHMPQFGGGQHPGFWQPSAGAQPHGFAGFGQFNRRPTNLAGMLQQPGGPMGPPAGGFGIPQ